MLSYKVKFISCLDNVYVKDTDFNACRYDTRKDRFSLYENGKQNYYEGQGQICLMNTKNKSKFKRKLFKLEEVLKKHRLIYSQWISLCDLCLIFSSGLICYITVNVITFEISKLKFDKYFVNKLLGNIFSAIITNCSILFTYQEKNATIVYLNESGNNIQKIKDREPKIQTIELFGSTRKSEKVLSSCVKVEGDATVLIWSSINSGEVFPWSPGVRGEDRANVHIYSLSRTCFNLVAFHHTKYEAVNVELSQENPTIFYTIEQKTKNKSGMLVEGSSFEINSGNVALVHAWSCSTLSPVHCVSRKENSVLMSCVDASILLRMENGVIYTVRAPFIPSSLCWSDDVLVAAEERGRIICWDRALQPLNTRLDLATHLTNQPILQTIISNPRMENDSRKLIFLVFSEGPLAFLNLTADNILRRHLRMGNMEAAVKVLKSYSWEKESDACLQMLHLIVGDLFRKPLNDVIELWLQEAIGTFLAPSHSLSECTLDMYEPHVRDIARKFFHHLVRYGRLDKAMSLAIDLGDYDLFVDIQHAARKVNCHELEEEAKLHAENCYEDSELGSSSCCSDCSRRESLTDSASLELSENPSKTVREPPPLPHLTASEESFPIAVIPAEPSTNCISIRPNIHQYLNRNTNLWRTSDKKAERVINATHKVVDVIPKPTTDIKRQTLFKQHLYLKELKEDAVEEKRSQAKHLYKPVYAQKSVLINREKAVTSLLSNRSNGYNRSNGNLLIDTRFNHRTGGEKNKVKFSDTVTIAVVPENMKPSCANTLDPKRELADSLPLCHPDLYLKDFTPLSSDTTYYV